MDFITSAIAMAALLFVVLSMIIIEDRKQKKRVRILKRTNTKPWNRSNR